MAVKIRLQRHGKKKAPLYTIVVADSRAPRDGKFIERLGTYNPTTVPATIELDNDKTLAWVDKGAQPTDTVKAILSFKGVLYKKHLQRGVKKGALTQEQADTLYTDHLEKKNDAIRRKKEEQLNKQKKNKTELLAAETKKREAMEAARKPVVEVAGASEEAATETEAPAQTEAPQQTEAPAAEAQTEAPEAAAPAEEAAPAEAKAEEKPAEAKAEETQENPPAEETAKEENPETPTSEDKA